VLAFAVSAFRLSTPFWVDSTILLLSKPTIADFITTCIVLTVLLFHLHLLRRQRLPDGALRLHLPHYGRNLSLFFGRYTLKLVVASLAISIVPLAAIVVDLFFL